MCASSVWTGQAISVAVVLFSSALSLGWPLSAQAEPITFAFKGHIAQSTGPAQLLFGRPVDVGSDFDGSITFDTRRGNDCSNCNMVIGAPYGFRINVGSGLTIDRVVTSWHDVPPILTQYTASAQEFSNPDYGRLRSFLVFNSPGAQVPVGDNFPSDPAVLQAFPEKTFFFAATVDIDIDEGQISPRDLSFGGPITSVTLGEPVAPIPEPSTLILVAAAGLSVVRARTRMNRIVIRRDVTFT